VTVTTGPDTHIINSGTNPGDPTPTLNMTRASLPNREALLRRGAR
jgi:hypothetical protein